MSKSKQSEPEWEEVDFSSAVKSQTELMDLINKSTKEQKEIYDYVLGQGRELTSCLSRINKLEKELGALTTLLQTERDKVSDITKEFKSFKTDIKIKPLLYSLPIFSMAFKQGECT